MEPTTTFTTFILNDTTTVTKQLGMRIMVESSITKCKDFEATLQVIDHIMETKITMNTTDLFQNLQTNW